MPVGKNRNARGRRPGLVRQGLRRALGLAAFAALVFCLIPPAGERTDSARGLRIYSAEGDELRRFRETQTGSFTSAAVPRLSEYPSHVPAAVIRAEDRRFYWHPGIDPLAILRAAWQNLRAGRVVSGGSTITQQLVRLVYHDELFNTEGPLRNRWLRKLYETLLALRLDLHLSKTEILTAYLGRVPLPGNRTGIAAGSVHLLGRSPRFLTEDEALALAVLIRRNTSGPAAIAQRFHALSGREIAPELLSKLAGSPANSRQHSDGAVPVARADQSENATPGDSPHFTDWLRRQFPRLRGDVHTRLSRNRNSTIHDIIQAEMHAVAELGAEHAAVVVLKIDASENRLILEGLVGSRDYRDPTSGQVNGATTHRTAGSTLKPFIYALAFDEQDLRPYSIVYDHDANVSLGDGAVYRPRNYDLNYWGAMTAREALATSRNIPAVKLTEQMGEDRVLRLLREAGFYQQNPTQAEQPARAFGPGIALGISGATLLDLTRAYGSFAMQGELPAVWIGRDANQRPLLYGGAQTSGQSQRLFSRETALRVTHMLSDRSMRRRAFGDRSFLDFPFDVAAKTGTSKDYRDAWTVGYSSRYVVGVWLGNFDATPMNNVSGAYGAGRIFHQVMRMLHRGSEQRSVRFRYPVDWRSIPICRHTGLRARSDCESYGELIPAHEILPVQCHGEHGAARTGTETTDQSTYARREPHGVQPGQPERILLSPVPGAVYYLDPHAPVNIQEIALRVHEAFRAGARARGVRIEYPGPGPGQTRTCDLTSCPPTLRLVPGDYRVRVFRDAELLESVEFRLE